MPCYIYINGYPGVGKLTVANELQGLLPDSRVYHHHLLIDPIAPIVERTSHNYQTIRTSLRRHVLNIIATADEVRYTTWIFTDSRSTSPCGATAAQDYKRAAEQRGARFIPIVLHCDLKENLRRMADEERISGGNTKLTDEDVLRKVREEEELYQFGGAYELQLDITTMRPAEVAKAIAEHIKEVEIREQGASSST
ncbi:hypothetical protein C8035_v007011 [Colletotrichum spinosum]|uniref:Uncharacterized protein n=1 Tax=Colletotrichum spinosum TaxID=1347390 RepID=A0A4R8QSJ3_9PEZI|nr:hypothetical protein C8035_v007011 [Colletotrichum spinosum]